MFRIASVSQVHTVLFVPHTSLKSNSDSAAWEENSPAFERLSMEKTKALRVHAETIYTVLLISFQSASFILCIPCYRRQIHSQKNGVYACVGGSLIMYNVSSINVHVYWDIMEKYFSIEKIILKEASFHLN